MQQTIILRNQIITYDLQYKKVKNINLRIKYDGNICVSANKRVSQKVINEFLLSKEDFLFRVLEKYQNKNDVLPNAVFREDEIQNVIFNLCEKVYPYFKKQGVKYPVIKFRKMVSRWGSCHTTKGILTFNTFLMYAPVECIEYVVLHEFTHFLQANHSEKFYKELEKVCPDWKKCKDMLKEINIR